MKKDWVYVIMTYTLLCDYLCDKIYETLDLNFLCLLPGSAFWSLNYTRSSNERKLMLNKMNLNP